jgi:hypothetical protein
MVGKILSRIFCLLNVENISIHLLQVRVVCLRYIGFNQLRLQEVKKFLADK